MSFEETESFLQRKKKLDEIRQLGVDPYPHKYTPKTTAAQLHQRRCEDRLLLGESDQAERGETEETSLAGRLTLFRAMGKNAFGNIQDGSGTIQVLFNRKYSQVTQYISNENLSPLKFIEKKCDLGDFLGIQGHLFLTKRGELTLYAKECTLLCKSLLPLPDKHSGLVDKELRYRKRWLDLITQPKSRDTFFLRSKILREIRRKMESLEFLEVETPILQNTYGGAEAHPFRTHLQSLNQNMFLRISLEPALKKLMVGGSHRIFEMGKVFRNEGIDRSHNPEFTLLEAYAAYWDYHEVRHFVEDLFHHLAKVVWGKSSQVMYHEDKEVLIDLAPPWKSMTMKESLFKYARIDVDSYSDEALRKEVISCREARALEVVAAMSRGTLIATLFEEKVESQLIEPHHILDHPVETTPLCKPHRKNTERELLVERFESFILGKEMCNAYTELNDPILQKKLFLQQREIKKREEMDSHPIDEEFIEAISQGMPPMGGLGIGIDRLVMLLTQNTSIREVLYFPLMRCENP